MKGIPVAAAAVLLAACTHAPVSEDYRGPTAMLTDSVDHVGGPSYAYVYYLKEYNGQRVDQTLMLESTSQYGEVFRKVKAVSRPVPAQDATFLIEGRSAFLMPAFAVAAALAGRDYEVNGLVQFKPEPNHTYVVTGTLGQGYQAVWLEDAATHALVGQKFEIGTAPSPVSTPSPAPAAAAVAAPAAALPETVVPAPEAAPAPSAPSAFTAGREASLKPGARLRGSRSLADGGVAIEGSVMLKMSSTNGEGTWWYVSRADAKGWISEADLAR